ncbi:MAG: MFS transporter [Bacteroidetes bacterium]|nr:MFS transporter [Bacteroidota bacterium]
MSEARYPAVFWRMCAGALLFFLSFNLMLSELPDALRRLGAPELLGWIIPSFALSALAARPLSGWLTDRLGRKWAMIGGTVFCVVAGVLYPLAGTVFFFFLVRVLHGFSTGFAPTGFSAFTTDVIPAQSRGEALGWQGLFSNLGTALGYSAGSWMVLQWGSRNMYLSSSVMAVLAVLLFLTLPETRPKQVHHPFSLRDVFYPAAWQPALIMCLVCIPLGALLTVMPDFTTSMGFSNKGLYLGFYVACSLLVRIFSGRLSDRLGRPLGTAIGSLCQLLSLLCLLLPSKVPDMQFAFFLSAVLYGIGQGFNAPALFAWAGDLSTSQNRGRALAMLFIALETGIIIGGLGGGYLLAATGSFALIFGLGAVFAALAFVLSIAAGKSIKKGH